jgi:hypothetical protein
MILCTVGSSITVAVLYNMEEGDKERLTKLISMTMGKSLIAIDNMWLQKAWPQWLFRDAMTDGFLNESYYGALSTHTP